MGVDVLTIRACDIEALIILKVQRILTNLALIFSRPKASLTVLMASKALGELEIKVVIINTAGAYG